MARAHSAVRSCAACVLVACAAPGAPAAEALPTFDVQEAVLFDDGIDLVENPEGVGGRWQEEWESELEQRVARGETVAVGMVHTLRTDLDLERRTSYRLVFRIEETLKGQTPEGDLTLLAHEGARGYTSVDRAREGVLDQRFVVFVSRFRGADGLPVTHWHLSPSSDAVMRRVRERIAQESPTFREVRVIERRD